MKRFRLHLQVTVLALLACGDAGGQGMTGTYEVPLPQGVTTLSVTVDDVGRAAGWMRAVDGTIYGVDGRWRPDGGLPGHVEGTVTGAMSAAFTLTAGEGGSFLFHLTPHDATGIPQPALGAVFLASRVSDSAVDAPDLRTTGTAAGAEPVGGGALDPRLVGVWSTQVVMNDPSGSIATELWMELTAEGVMRDLGSRAMGTVGIGSFDASGGGGEAAQWRTEGDVIQIRSGASPWVPFARFEFSDGRLVLRYLQDGSIQIWSKRS